jgi:hypothetical protein
VAHGLISSLKAWSEPSGRLLAPQAISRMIPHMDTQSLGTLGQCCTTFRVPWHLRIPRQRILGLPETQLPMAAQSYAHYWLSLRAPAQGYMKLRQTFFGDRLCRHYIKLSCAHDACARSLAWRPGIIKKRGPAASSGYLHRIWDKYNRQHGSCSQL